ncbi:MAG TPA: CBS domain-containing protein [bacterium]|nr:CBS domain-containing protein [bacterium]
MSKVSSILSRKGFDVVTVSPKQRAMDAVNLMNEHRIGAVIVIENDAVVGIFTERDLLRKIIAKGKRTEDTLVGQAMSTPVAYCTPETTIDECRLAMTQKRIRHLPVVENGKLKGLVSIGDVMAWELSEQQTTIQYLNEYISGR